MAGVQLYDYQLEAVQKMRLGCILCGGVGSGKSRTGLAFYYQMFDGKLNTEEYVPMVEPEDLYIITTARKRDTGEWDEELAPFFMSTDESLDLYNQLILGTTSASTLASNARSSYSMNSVLWAMARG